MWCPVIASSNDNLFSTYQQHMGRAGWASIEGVARKLFHIKFNGTLDEYLPENHIFNEGFSHKLKMNLVAEGEYKLFNTIVGIAFSIYCPKIYFKKAMTPKVCAPLPLASYIRKCIIDF